MNNTVKEFATDFYKKAIEFANVSRSDFQNALKQELSRFYTTKDKFDFISDFTKNTNHYYQKHLQVCTSPDTCPKNKMCENALFFSEQESERLKQQLENEGIQLAFGTYIGNLHISGNNSFLNLGEIKDTIVNNSQQLQESGKEDVSKSLNELIKAIESITEINSTEKVEMLEQVNYLSEQALIEPDKRTNKNVLKAIIKGLFDSLSAFSNISTIAGLNLKDLSEYFLK